MLQLLNLSLFVAYKLATSKSLQGLATRVSKYLSNGASSVLKKIIGTVGGDDVAKLGFQSSEAAAKEVATELAKKVATSSAAKIGTEITAEATVDATDSVVAGPFAPLAFATQFGVEMAITSLPMILDATDAGGYMKMGTLELYINTKKGIDQAIQQMYTSQGILYPPVVGPFDNMDPTTLGTSIGTEIGKLTDCTTTPVDPIVKPYCDAVNSYVFTNNTTTDTANINNFYNLIDQNALNTKAQNNVCTAMGGKVIDVSNGKSVFYCSYPDKATCDSSYGGWPLTDGKIYAEYKKDIFGKGNDACMLTSATMRNMCTSNNLNYNESTGLCNITKDYCTMKGASWGYNKNIGQYDCIIDPLQTGLEAIFGTTIVRGLKQIFDPADYTSCNSGEIDDLYFCKTLTCKGNDQIYGALNTIFPDALIDATGIGLLSQLCYPQCPHGFSPVLCCICSQVCPQGTTDTGAFCESGCNGDDELIGALCYAKCETGYTSNGLICWEDSCPAGYDNFPFTCTSEVKVYQKKITPASKKPCPSGSNDTGTDCDAKIIPRGVGTPLIPTSTSCPSGSHNIAGVCWQGLKSVGTTHGLGCPSGKENENGLCYTPCPPNTKGVGNNCFPNNLIVTKLSDRYYCSDPNQVFDGIATCKDKCPVGYNDLGTTCNKPANTIDKKSHIRVPYSRKSTPKQSQGRGVGYVPKISIRAKKRSVPFSTKSNFILNK